MSEDPNTSAVKLRQMAESFAQFAAASAGVYQSRSGFLDTLKALLGKRVITPRIADAFHEIRLIGNKAAHDTHFRLTEDGALDLLRTAHRLAIWFARTFSSSPNLIIQAFVEPDKDFGGTGTVIVPNPQPDGMRPTTERETLSNDPIPTPSGITTLRSGVDRQEIDFGLQLANLQTLALKNPTAFVRMLHRSEQGAEGLSFPPQYLGCDLVVLDGQKKLSHRIFLLRNVETLVGRAPECDVVLDDSSVSRHHARVVLEGDKARFVDLRSRNGIWHRGEKVSEAVIEDREIIRLGRIPIAFVRSEEEVA